MGLGSSAGKVKKSESFDAAKTEIQEKMIVVYELLNITLPSKAKCSNDFHKTSSCQQSDYYECFLIIMHLCMLPENSIIGSSIIQHFNPSRDTVSHMQW